MSEGRSHFLAAYIEAVEQDDMQRPKGLPDCLTGQGLACQLSRLAEVPLANQWGGVPGGFTMASVDPAHLTGVVVLSNLSITHTGRDAVKTIAAVAMEVAARG